MGEELDYHDKQREEFWSDIHLSSTSDLSIAIGKKAEKEPITIGEVYQVSKDREMDITRSTVKTLMNNMASTGELMSKRPRKKSAKIFWKSWKD